MAFKRISVSIPDRLAQNRRNVYKECLLPANIEEEVD